MGSFVELLDDGEINGSKGTLLRLSGVGILHTWCNTQRIQVPNTWVILADNTNENWLEKEFPPKLEKKKCNLKEQKKIPICFAASSLYAVNWS